MHDIVAPYLYHSVVTDDVLGLAYGYTETPGTVPQRQSKAVLLRYIRELRTVGEIHVAWKDPVGRIIGKLTGEIETDPTDIDGDITYITSTDDIAKAVEERSDRLSSLARANAFPSVEKYAISVFEPEYEGPWYSELWDRYAIHSEVTHGLRGIVSAQHVCEVGARFDPYRDSQTFSLVTPGGNDVDSRLGSYTQRLAEIHELPSNLSPGVAYFVGRVKDLPYEELASILEGLAVKLGHTIKSSHDHPETRQIVQPIVTIILSCPPPRSECEQIINSYPYPRVTDGHWFTKPARSYLSVFQQTWSAIAKQNRVPKSHIRITTILTAEPCLACGKVTRDYWGLGAHLGKSGLEELTGELRNMQEQDEKKA